MMMMVVVAIGNTVPACRALLLIGGMHACYPCLHSDGQEIFIFSKVIRTSCRCMEVVSHDGRHCKFHNAT